MPIMKSNRLLNSLQSYYVYKELKEDMSLILTQVTFDPVKDKVQLDQINGNIECFVSSMEIEQEEFDKVCGFEVDLASVDYRSIYDDLQELQESEKHLSGMSDAWESDDACDAACNDPGLQYEQGQLVDELWASFDHKYKTQK